MRRAPLLASMALAIAAPAAAAQDCVAPPGTAAIEQYCETLPGAAGPSPTVRREEAPSRRLPARTVRELERSGTPGRELTRVLQTAPVRAARGGEPRAERGRELNRDAPAPSIPDGSGNPLSAVRSAAGGGETIGGGFAWILLAIAVGMGGASWLRRRRHAG